MLIRSSVFSLKTILAAVSFISATIISSATFASGGYGGGGGYSQPRQQQKRVVDQNYEAGKSIFSGRQGAPKLNYCVKQEEGESVKLNRRSIKPLKRASFNEFASNIVECQSNDKLVQDSLSGDQFLLVAYYLNKRFKLYLN